MKYSCGADSAQTTGRNANMLTLAALSRAFGGLKVIERLDLTVEMGDVLGVIGPERGGKEHAVQYDRWRPAAKRRPYPV